ncbi:carboxypeptidase-like regulatory domain-containing protein [Thiorhodovibrio winogradskyi]|nr:carboxypeptidase-like regulatory domain-containing protein [Thiorhodovibrio winogradskyi]
MIELVPEAIPAAAWHLLLRVGAGAGALILLLSANPVLAHKLQVFAAVEGSSLSGTAYFTGGSPASGARIIITNAAGEPMAELEPTADGRFSYQINAPVAHRVIAETADGHRAEWQIPAAALAGAFSQAAADTPAIAAKQSPEPTAERGPAAGESQAPAQLHQMPPALEAALARQLRPLREELLATREALRLQDILGGIGYIFGLSGLALWWRCQRSRSDQ